MKPRIGRTRGLSPEVIERLQNVASSTVADAMGRSGAMSHRISPLRSPARLAGPAVTVRCAPNDNLMIHRALQLVEPGDVLVVDTQHSYDVGLLGNNMAIHAINKGVVGVVIDGSVRDVAALRASELEIFCVGVAPTSGFKQGSGSVNHAIECGGVIVEAGDAVVGDDDGVAVIPLGEVEKILAASEKRQLMESKQETAVARGQIPLEILYGPTWVDEAVNRLDGES